MQEAAAALRNATEAGERTATKAPAQAGDDARSRPRPSETDDYARLKRQIKEAGLLDKQPRYYAYRVPISFALLIPGVAAVLLFDSLLIQIFNAIYLAFVFTQIAFVGHDAGHRQICSTPPKNDRVAFLGIPLVGLSYSWWVHTHNLHHTWPNQMEKDPAVTYPFLAFSEEQARMKRGIWRFLVRFQGLYFLPMSCLYPISMRINSVKFFLRGQGKKPRTEFSLIVLHNIAYFTLVFVSLPWLTALIFVLVHQAVFSIFIVSAFAPNHKGMPILREDEKPSFFIQQVVTAQNVRGGRLVDIWYGGLNYQIEHHLFPSLPRNRLREAAEIVRPYCESLKIPYTETSVYRFYFDLLLYMHRVGRAVRRRAPSPVAEPASLPSA